MQGSVAERKRESLSLRDRGKPDRGGKQQEREYQTGKGCVRENTGKTEKESVQDRESGGGERESTSVRKEKHKRQRKSTRQ